MRNAGLTPQLEFVSFCIWRMLPCEIVPRVHHQLVAFFEFCASFFTWWRGTLWRTRDWSLDEPQQFLRSSFLYSSLVHSGGGANHAHMSRKAAGVARDKNGHIARSSTAREHFMKQHPCPSTGKTSGACPDYVVDHVVALKHGGKDDPNNMQWQTIQAAKIKDRTE
jgi:hypothetical protein